MNLSDIKGFGKGTKGLAALQAAGINSLLDFLRYFPRTYIDPNKITKIADLKVNEERGTAPDVIIGQVNQTKNDRYGNRPFEVLLGDDTGNVKLTFFGAKEHWQRELKEGEKFVAIGKLRKNKFGNFFDREIIQSLEKFSGKLISIYTITEKMSDARIDSKALTKKYEELFQKNLSLILKSEERLYPQEILEYLEISNELELYKKLHLPQSEGECYSAKKNISKLELLPFCLRMARRRRLLLNSGVARKLENEKMLLAEKSLSFELTAGQKNALSQIKTGLESSRQFHALLQGDVGSGKTVVAILSMIGVCAGRANGEVNLQSAIMVPTDILARQHLASMSPLFERVNLKIALLVGAMSAPERRKILLGLKDGSINAVIGTHALFSAEVEFANLGFVIIDEQHRFGVSQREKLLAKGDKPDLLVMSATPIPRSLAMTFYGDLENIILAEKPPGRKEVETRIGDNSASNREKMKTYLYAQSQKGNRCYWVVSRVQEISDGDGRNVEAKTVGDIYNELKEFKSDWKVAAVHGQMSEEERDKNLTAFANGEISLIVCTTVVEVGVNVPEANLMVIDKPEQFGLSTLHQLRGRIGRGNEQATCFLFCDTANHAHDRLTKFASTTDGFKIAELDLENRGAGNLEGSDQSGKWILRWFDWKDSQPLIEKTITVANEILDNKPNFPPETLQKIQSWYNDKKFENIEDGVH
ncbi:ATP-dependent DNA helicase RecG [Fibrobacterales bacterium]|nr:ATP-dependent DNA helicase RecG [Fibrobacterales bacterium]